MSGRKEIQTDTLRNLNLIQFFSSSIFLFQHVMMRRQKTWLGHDHFPQVELKYDSVL